MKGLNPFTPYVDSPLEIKGRRAELDMFGGFLNDISAGKGRILLVSGIRGIGKSEILRRMRIEAEKRGFFSPLISAGADEGFGSFISRLYSGFLSYADIKTADKGLSDRVLVSLKTQYKEGKDDFFLTFIKSANKHSEGLVVFIDDADELKESEKLANFLSKCRNQAQNSHLNLGIVISHIEGIDMQDIGQQMRLLPLDEHNIREIVESGLKKGPPKMGEECLRSVVDESSGNPKIVKTILYTILDKLPDKEKIITQRHYLTFYPSIMDELARNLFDQMYQALPESEKEVLRGFAEEGKAAYISDIARKIKKRHATTLALRLVERGQLVRVSRGVYQVFTKLYARYVMQRRG